MTDVTIPNLASYFVERANANPRKIAIDSGDRSITYGDLLTVFYRFREGIRRRGMRRGQRVLILMPVSIELYALLLAFLSEGVVCVSIDASLPRSRVLDSIVVARPDVIISVDRVLRFRFGFPLLRPRFLARFFKIRFFSADSRGFFLRPLSDLLPERFERLPLEATRREELALITYTTGTTGRPKGADRASDVLIAQHRISEALWPHRDDEVDMPCFPMVGLQNLSCGITTALPVLDLRRLDAIDAEAVVKRIVSTGVTRISGPPSFFDQVSSYLIRTNQRLASIERLVTGGAPVPRWLCQRILSVFPNVEAHVVYGSTEAEPMAAILFPEVIEAEGDGYLLGYPIREIEMRVIETGHSIIESMSDRSSLILPQGQTGEIIVKGPHVVRRYHDNAAANAETKVFDPNDGRVWHRTGDEGYFDSSGRLWLVGRISDRILIGERSFAHFPVELAVERVSGARRAAVLSADSKVHVFLERESGAQATANDGAIHREIRKYLGVDAVSIRGLKTLPVDHRHFWRIDRKKLREMIS